MEEKKKCMCGSSDVRVVACCGASNVGQIANQAAIELAKEKVAGFFCLAGVGGHIKGMVKSAKEAGLMIEPAVQIIVTELGIEKSPDFAPDEKACSKVIEKVKEELAT